MTDDVRSSPRTGTVLPRGRPFWIVDGRAYDFTEWARVHPGGATWFGPSQGRDISALLHTYHRDPVRLRKFLSRYEIDGFTERDVLPKLGVPPFLLEPGFDAARDLPRLDYADEGSLLADIRTAINERFSKRDLKRLDRRFDLVTWVIGLAHVAMLASLAGGLTPAWAFVIVMVLTRTALAGAGHYHLHRRWNDKRRLQTPLGKALFDINYVGTSLIGTDGHVLLHHPYMGSGADVKKTFFDGMLRLHPVLRVPGYTLHKLGICLLGLSLRAREIARFEQRGGNAPIRLDFWLVRAWLLVELVACVVTGHWLAWLVQFFLTLWYNTFLVVSSHDFEDDTPDDLTAIPVTLRDDWAAHQICLSYDLTIVGNRWLDLWLSAGLSPHRVHHVLPYQASGFANLRSEATVRAVCERAGITWERPRNLLFDRFPAVIRHYLFRPAKALPLPPPPPGSVPPLPGSVPPLPGSVPPLPGSVPPLPGSVPLPPGSAPSPPGSPLPPPRSQPSPSTPPPSQPSAPGDAPIGSAGGFPTPPAPVIRPVRAGQLGLLVRYTVDGFRGVGV